MGVLRIIAKVATSGTVGNILSPIVDAISPAIRSLMVELIAKLDKAAKATPNEADDALIDLLQNLLKITDEELLAAQAD